MSKLIEKLFYIKVFIYNQLYKYNLVKKLKSRDKKFILIGSPLHGNLGDQAISIAEKIYLNENFNGIDLVEIPTVYFKKFESTIKEYISKEDIILIHGGGFFGTLWPYEVEVIYKAVKIFSQNRIIIMPQTIFFENTKYGSEQLELSKQIFSTHKRLCICTREKISFDFAINNYKNKILLVPDIVLYLYDKINLSSKSREGVLLCFREDKERNIVDTDMKYIVNKLRSKNIKIKYTDTVVKYNIYEKNRSDELKKKLEEFLSAKLVITDRLHGMIFSAITKTPCIVFQNNNHKIKGVYDWLKGTSKIKLLFDVREFDDCFDTIELCEEPLVLNEIHRNFEPLTRYISSCLQSGDELDD